MKYTFTICSACGKGEEYNLFHIESPFIKLYPTPKDLSEILDLCHECLIEWQSISYKFFKEHEKIKIDWPKYDGIYKSVYPEFKELCTDLTKKNFKMKILSDELQKLGYEIEDDERKGIKIKKTE